MTFAKKVAVEWQQLGAAWPTCLLGSVQRVVDVLGHPRVCEVTLDPGFVEVVFFASQEQLDDRNDLLASVHRAIGAESILPDTKVALFFFPNEA